MNLVLIVAALIIVFLVFTWLLKVVKATVATAIAIGLLILAVYVLFGIGPVQVWQPILESVQSVWRTITGGR